MRFEILGAMMMTMAAFSYSSASNAADDAVRISDPSVHDNLAVYFIHGKSAEGPVPLTLEEALAKGKVEVKETGEVNELKIENTGNEGIFIQSGDIVKGGRQDRVITSSFVLPPKSGEVPLAAFCVEHGRWSARGTESSVRFALSAEAMPSREAKLAMRAPRVETSSLGADSGGSLGAVYERQADVWASVASMQSKLSSGLSENVAAAESETSLQLSLENDKLKKTRAAYVEALEAAGQSSDDIIGYAFAINGKLNSADVYASNGLFRKMWSKQLQSAATEAIANKDGKNAAPPAAETVTAFLADAKNGTVRENSSTNDNRLEIRDSEKAVYFAASPSLGAAIHQSYIAK